MNQTPLSRVFNAPFYYQDCWRYVRSLHSMNTKTINYLYRIVMNLGEANTMYIRDVTGSYVRDSMPPVDTIIYDSELSSEATLTREKILTLDLYSHVRGGCQSVIESLPFQYRL
ncbi:hypothetical protein QCA50_008786 [Cerrena zonata]|uniref:Uncharacterized protein n=1 Tax=Cerrena zonata TaxID=2478898 RepID=A0AAW0GE95_9APHY